MQSLKYTVLMYATPTGRFWNVPNREFVPYLLMKKRVYRRWNPWQRESPSGLAKLKKRESEYRRHGNQALLAGMDVMTGKIIRLVSDTRTEHDF